MTPLLTRTVAPTQQPITLDDAKLQLRVLDNDEDAYIDSLISAAVSYIDGPTSLTNRALVTQTWAYSVAAPDGNVIKLPLTPVQSITSIEYYDSEDVLQSATVGDFYLYSADDWAYIEPKSGVSWPTTRSRRDAIKVTFVAGYGDRDAVPDTAKHIVRLLVSDWYENRGAIATQQNRGITLQDLPLGVRALVNQLRVGWAA